MLLQVPPLQAIFVNCADDFSQYCAKPLSHHLQLTVERISQYVVIDVSDQMNEALLLFAKKRIVPCVEIRNKNPLELSKHFF